MRNSKIKTILLSTIASTILIGCGGGGDSTTTTTNTDSILESRDISGVAIDGYLSGSHITLGSHSEITDALGRWSISNYTPSTLDILSVQGGIDTATGEDFEGVLKAPIGEAGEEVVVTPLSTLVSSFVEKGSTVAQAQANVADAIGISAATIKADPIALLKSGDASQKAEAAKAIKKSLVIQKTAETFAKSVGTDEASLDSAFDAVMDSIAEKISADVEISVDEIMADTSAIAEKMFEKLSETSADANLEAKLTAAASSAKAVVETVETMNESDLANAGDNLTKVLEAKSKGIEVATAAIEKIMETIAASADVTAIDDAKQEADTTAKAIVMLGGAEAMATKIAQQIEKAEDGKTIDASDFGDVFLSDETIATQAETFDTLQEAGFTPDMIADVGSKISNDDSTQSISEIMDSVVEEAKAEAEAAGETFVEIDVSSVVSSVETSVSSAQEAVESAAEVAIIEEPTFVVPETEEPTVEVPETEEPTVEVPETEEPTVEVPETVEPTTKIVNVTGAGTNTANLNATYNFTAGNYTYTIDGFSSGDVLNFPAGNVPTVVNTTFGDTSLTVQWAYNGNVINVNLTGLSTSADNTIYGLSTFKTAFGSGSVTPAVISDATAVNVTTTGTSDAASGDITYSFSTLASGAYTYTVNNFNDGDVLDFPTGNAPTVINTDFTDGQVTVQWANSGSVINVNLTIPTEDDSALYSLDAFKTAFGNSSIQ